MHEESAPEAQPPAGEDTGLVEYAAAARRSRGEVHAWIALLLFVVGIFALQRAAPPPVLDAETSGSMDFRIRSRYLLGLHHLFGGLSLGGFSQDQLLQQLEDGVRTADEAVCMVPVLAEISGGEAALARIAKLRAREDLDDADLEDLSILEGIFNAEVLEASGAALAAFRERRTDFADLALSYNLAPDDPERMRVLARAQRMAAGMVGVGMSVLGGVLLGLVLLGAAMVMVRQGRWRPAYPDSVRPERPEDGEVGDGRHIYVWTLVLFMLSTIFCGLLGAVVAEQAGMAAGLAMNVLALPVLLWPLLRGISKERLYRAYGWHKGAGVWQEIGAGIAAYLAGLPILASSLLISMGLSQLVQETPSHPLVDGIVGASAIEMAAIFLLAAVWAPVAEEAIFRGGFYHYLRGRLGMIGAALASSIVFALIHPQGIVGVPPLVALAMIFAVVREWRGSLIGPMAIHAVHNGALTTVMFLMLT